MMAAAAPDDLISFEQLGRAKSKRMQMRALVEDDLWHPAKASSAGARICESWLAGVTSMGMPIDCGVRQLCSRRL
jgi:hypothetical protein